MWLHRLNLTSAYFETQWRNTRGFQFNSFQYLFNHTITVNEIKKKIEKLSAIFVNSKRFLLLPEHTPFYLRTMFSDPSWIFLFFCQFLAENSILFKLRFQGFFPFSNWKSPGNEVASGSFLKIFLKFRKFQPPGILIKYILVYSCTRIVKRSLPTIFVLVKLSL